MPTLGLVVEGDYDEAALIELIHKCLQGEAEVIGRPTGSVERLMKGFPGLLEESRYARQGFDVDKAIVIRDADSKNPVELKTRMQGKISNRIYPFPVKLLVIVQELEAWLLADENAISSVRDKRHRAFSTLRLLMTPREG